MSLNDNKKMLKKQMIIFTLLVKVSLNLNAQVVYLPDILKETRQQHEERMEWWHDAKFGMFITWGVSSVPGKGEWIMWNQQIPVEEYEKFTDEFKPEINCPEQWASLARSAGMNYMVLTTRHCDGFSNWDSKASYRDFTIMNTPAKFDAVERYVAACRKYDLRIGFYYSPADWRFPGYFLPDLYRSNAEKMKEQTYKQVKELLINYGKVDILWWDAGGDDFLAFGCEPRGGELRKRETTPSGGLKWPMDKHFAGKPLWEGNMLNAMVRELQPDIIVNDRANIPGIEWEGDFTTPERKIGTFDTVRCWETCDALLEDSWGWKPDQKIKSLEYIITTMVRVVTGDGNYLLNVGPRPDGTIEPEQVEKLMEVGRWMEKYGESIYKTRGGPCQNGEWGGFTLRDNVIYVHVLDWSKMPEILPAIDREIRKATCLSGGKVNIIQSNNGLKISVSGQPEGLIDTIIKLELSKN
jgi:alpha-L-fucosidase